MASPIIVFITAAPGEARQLAQSLVSERLAACVNIIPGVNSIYEWQGAVEEGQEHLLVVKSDRCLWERLTQRVCELHSYETPEIVSVSIEAGYQPYLDWLAAATGQKVESA